VITLVVQGFTLAPLVRRAGIAIAPADVAHEHTVAQLHLARAGLAHLEQLADLELASDVALDQLRRRLSARIDRIEADRSTPTPSRRCRATARCAGTCCRCSARNSTDSSRPAPSATPPADGSCAA